MITISEMLPSDIQLYTASNASIRVYTTEVCPKCKKLKNLLDSHSIPYDVIDMQSPEGLTELRFNGVFSLEAPVLQIRNEFLTAKQMFKGQNLLQHIILEKLN